MYNSEYKLTKRRQIIYSRTHSFIQDERKVLYIVLSSLLGVKYSAASCLNYCITA